MARRMHEGVALQVLTTCGLAHRDDGETDRSPQYDPGLSMNHTELKPLQMQNWPAAPVGN
jgi:hypothetical protein